MIPWLSQSARQKRYIDRKMDQVSRSFALVVRMLESPLDLWLSTAYLVCRVIDNIEDCIQPALWKTARFEETRRMLARPQDARHVLALWEFMEWPGLTVDERSMMSVRGGLTLWEVFAALPQDAQSIIDRWAGEMSRGMDTAENAWDAPQVVQRDGVRILERVQDYDRYCYFVAGTVGYMATELVNAHYDLDQVTAERLLSLCEACGRALQKTNIVKDFAKDLGRGVSYLPDEWMRSAGYAPLQLQGAPEQWKAMVIGNVVEELRASTDYVLALPPDAERYRLASLMSMLPAYETILLAARCSDILFTGRHHVKISRLSMAQCAKDAHRMLHDDAAIVDYGRSIEHQIDEMFMAAAPVY